MKSAARTSVPPNSNVLSACLSSYGLDGIFRPQCREYGFCIQTALEGDDAALGGGGEGLGRSAERFGGGDEDPVSALCGLPQERDPLHEVPFGPEAQNLKVNRIAGLCVPEREVWDQRGLKLRDGEYPRARFELPPVLVLRPVPGLRERLAHVALAHVRRAFVVACESGSIGVEFQG